MSGQNTLLLDTVQWDLVLNAAGDIAMASPPYSLAQDVASACRTFLGEVWYDTRLGIPYFEEILGHSPPPQTFEQYMAEAALTVPGVVNAQCTITSINNRTLRGQVTFTATDGTTQTVNIGSV
jgi:hypothetical protein